MISRPLDGVSSTTLHLQAASDLYSKEEREVAIFDSKRRLVPCASTVATACSSKPLIRVLSGLHM